MGITFSWFLNNTKDVTTFTYKRYHYHSQNEKFTLCLDTLYVHTQPHICWDMKFRKYCYGINVFLWNFVRFCWQFTGLEYSCFDISLFLVHFKSVTMFGHHSMLILVVCLSCWQKFKASLWCEMSGWIRVMQSEKKERKKGLVYALPCHFYYLTYAIHGFPWNIVALET